ncbi:MAG: hypothetical protein OEQ13_03210 [Acidobacteriota bacterium]|nr:hypothetical protein [Acidobacteriota bacterium]
MHWLWEFVIVVFVLMTQVIFVIPVWKVAIKLGYPGWYSLILWVPVVNLFAMYWVAFKETPMERRLGAG